jgi:hypothetical protein
LLTDLNELPETRREEGTTRMNKHRLWKWMTLATLVVAVLFAAVIVGAQDKTPKTAGAEKPDPTPANSHVQSQPTGGDQQEAADGRQPEGIKVHGHWTIVVRNADGSMASQNEFENALTTGSGGGNAALSQFLGRQYAIGTWQISFGNPSNSSQDPCRTANGTPVICFIVESSSKITGTYVFPNLSVQLPGSGSNAFSIVLSGTATAAAAGSISNVHTNLGACPSSVSPSACSGSAENSTGFGFTGQTLTSPISVQAGQSISVTVVLSFT